MSKVKITRNLHGVQYQITAIIFQISEEIKLEAFWKKILQ